MFLEITDIIIENRERKEFPHIDDLANSIREYGLIQPIILEPINGLHPKVLKGRLITGECRLRAIQRLGWTQLEHGRHFIWLDEVNRDPVRRKAIELEENLRRRQLSWQEEIVGKQKLFDLMQQLYGHAVLGAPRQSDQGKEFKTGFGVNRLATMLGENKAITSKDLSLARAMGVIPSLAAAESKNAAFRQANLIANVASMYSSATQKNNQEDFILYEGHFEANIQNVPDNSVDLIYTDLPYGVNLDSSDRHRIGVEYSDKLIDIKTTLPVLISEAYRVLASNRFAVFFFGFRYYQELFGCLLANGFDVDPMPFIWFKNTYASEAPHCIYARSYDAALITRKGKPSFIRQGQQNFINLNRTGNDRLHIAQQPVELVEKFIKDMITPGATVLDFCAGSGTTGVAALRQKCKVILFEKDPLACKIIKIRLKNG